MSILGGRKRQKVGRFAYCTCVLQGVWSATSNHVAHLVAHHVDLVGDKVCDEVCMLGEQARSVMTRSMTRTDIVAVAVMLAGMSVLTAGAAAKSGLTGMEGSSYYKVHPMFHPFPDEKKGVQSIDRFGPVGIGIELLQPAFKMRVKNVEEGAPAAATGKLKKGQLIDSINGRVMEKMDPRQILGDIIARAEATDGVVKLMIRENKDTQPSEVVVRIPVLGAYSKTWPLNCRKSDRIVRGMAEYLKKTGANGMGMGTLFLLSTGDESDLEFVRGRMREVAEANKEKTELGHHTWNIGYSAPALCEYYLRTGDTAILHTIKLYAEGLTRTMYNNAWGGRGIGNYNYMAGGHMNAAGVHAVTFLQLAKECGVDVDETTLQRSLKHFYRYAGHGAVSYGDGLPEGTYTDNGRNGGLAFAMAAAASLTPEGEKSVYAKARDASAMTSFYSTSWLLHGHTGGGIGEIWRGAAMGLMQKKKPAKYQQFMDNRAWFYDISRRFDGSMGIVGGGRYDNPAGWGLGLALAYTVPRQKLRIYGAPKTKFCKSYQLPKRPWGTAADEVFFSLKAAPVRGGKPHDVDAETLVEDGSWPVLRKLAAEDVTDEFMLRYTHHPDFNLRSVYSANTVRSRGRDDLVLEMLRSKDPRVRRAGIVSIDTERLSDEMVELMLGMVNDPEESWWVVLTAMDKLGAAKAELIVPHIDRLVYWLKHGDWWISRAALTALTKAAVDKRYYKTILPIVGRMIVDNTSAVALAPLGQITKELQAADPEVQVYAIEVLSGAYAGFPTTIRNPYGTEITSAVPYLHGGISRNLAALPGGFDALYTAGKKRFPEQALPHKDLFMAGDASTFGPVVRKALEPIVRKELIPQYIGKNRDLLLKEKAHATPKWGFYYRYPRMADLVALYNRIEVHDYDWRVFGPDLTEVKWDYHSFDPPEKKPWEPGWRYREVTYPTGMENWFAVEFDARKAGWQSGFAPFGQEDGKLRTERKRWYDQEILRPLDQRKACAFDFCRCCDPQRTLWEKEVLLMRAKLTLPPLKEDHRYRLVVGGLSHVNNGDGFRIYVNGKLFMERNRGVGRREGDKPICKYIDRTWWPDFQGDTTIAATSFLRIHLRSKVKGNHFAVWLQEMRVPPLGQEDILASIRAVPMTSARWQALQDPEDEGIDPEAGKFRWNGEFERNKAIEGGWVQLGQVASIDAFKPAERIKSNKGWPLQQLELRAGGKTGEQLLMWTGDILMDLNGNQALKMSTRTIDGAEYLFVESGGFNAKHGPEWRSPLYVMKRK